MTKEDPGSISYDIGDGRILIWDEAPRVLHLLGSWQVKEKFSVVQTNGIRNFLQRLKEESTLEGDDWPPEEK